MTSASNATRAAEALKDSVTKNGVTVSRPWARATPGGASNGVAYLEIRETDGVNDCLIGISSPVANRAELHSHTMDGNVMRMRRIDRLQLNTGSSVLLQPRGDHIMLMDLKAALKEGDRIALSLTFEKAGVIDVEATVEAIGANAPRDAIDQSLNNDPKQNTGGHAHHH